MWRAAGLQPQPPGRGCARRWSEQGGSCGLAFPGGRRGARAKAGKSTRRLRVLNPAARCVNTGAMTLTAKSNVLSGFLAIAWSCAPSAWAWGGQGHRTIGAIADRLLSSASRAAVAQLLSDDLDKF